MGSSQLTSSYQCIIAGLQGAERSFYHHCHVPESLFYLPKILCSGFNGQNPFFDRSGVSPHCAQGILQWNDSIPSVWLPCHSRFQCPNQKLLDVLSHQSSFMDENTTAQKHNPPSSGTLDLLLSPLNTVKKRLHHVHVRGRPDWH